MEARENVEAENAWDAEKGNRKDIDEGSLLSIHSFCVNPETDDVLKDGNKGAHRCETYKYEKERSPETTTGHLVEDVGQGDEDQGRTCVGLHSEGEGGREYDQTAAQSNECIQADDTDGLSGKAVFLVDVGAEDGYAADAKAQREERLSHCCIDSFKEIFPEFGKIWNEIEFQTLRAAFQGKAVAGKDEHQAQEADHHVLGDFLYTAL